MNEILARGIITIVSVIVITFLGNIFKLGSMSIFYAAIASVIVTNVDFKDLLKKSKERLLGTFVGGLVAILFIYPVWNQYLAIILGEIIVIYFCEKIIKIPSAIGSVIFLIIIYGIPSSQPYMYALMRIGNTCFGILVTVFVTYIIKKMKFIQ